MSGIKSFFLGVFVVGNLFVLSKVSITWGEQDWKEKIVTIKEIKSHKHDITLFEANDGKLYPAYFATYRVGDSMKCFKDKSALASMYCERIR